jgi:REP element-mobilizing transposase RayT
LPRRRHGVDIFTRSVYADLVIESLNFYKREKGLCVHAWVLMPNHLHAILSAKDGFILSDILRDFKKFTAGKILKELEKSTIESRKSWMLWLFKSAGLSSHSGVLKIPEMKPTSFGNRIIIQLN